MWTEKDPELETEKHKKERLEWDLKNADTRVTDSGLIVVGDEELWSDDPGGYL